MEKIKKFFEKNNINTDNILVMTIQKNRTTEFTSFVIDFHKNEVLPNYPSIFLNEYKEIKINNKYYICYKENLPILNNKQDDNKKNDNNIFCCNKIKEYKGKSINRENVFKDFLNKKGNHTNIIYEIKKQINNGELLWIKYFQLINDEIIEIDGLYNNKLHSFKNYKCDNCNMFYAIDLYDKNNKTRYNYHHMRLNPFTKINNIFLNHFYEEINL